MSRGTGTKKLLNKEVVTKLLAGDAEELAKKAEQGGNTGSRQDLIDKTNEMAKNTLDVSPAELERAAKAVGMTPEELEAELKKQGYRVDRGLLPGEGAKVNAKRAKTKGKGEGEEGEEKASEPWYARKGPGLSAFLRSGSNADNFIAAYALSGGGGAAQLEADLKDPEKLKRKANAAKVLASKAGSAPAAGQSSAGGGAPSGSK